MKRTWSWSISSRRSWGLALALTASIASPAAAADPAAPAAQAIQKGATGDAAAAESAHAQMVDAQGKSVGWVRIRETPNGVILHARLTGLPPGEHAFHVHAVGKCEPPFDSAGPHFNPENHKHGFAVEGGWHSGDLPNVTIPAEGALEVDILATDLSVSDGDEKMLDADGSALIVHAGVDDYTTQPTGNAGARIACGVVKAGAMAGADASAK